MTNHLLKFRLVFSWVLLLIFFNDRLFAQVKTSGLIVNTPKSRQGYVLFAPLFSKTTFLINKKGEKVHSWQSRFNPAQSVYLLPDGKLLRTGNDSSKHFTGAGGQIELLGWNSEVLWRYAVSDSLQCQHHDVCALPNGNILALVWVKKSVQESLDSGREPDKLGKCIWSEKIIEIKPGEKNSGQIVWQWEIWDHLIQDKFADKKNYGIVAANPGLLNINYKANVSEDWLHFNSLHYNEKSDQIMISNRNLNEIYIIDHSTTSQEAKGHQGGRQGRGGDILYRWGNPASYNSGTEKDQKLFRQHNAHWISNGLPFAADVMIFNNGPERPEGEFSTVEILRLPVDTNGNYRRDDKSAFLPGESFWQYKADPDTSFFSINVSSAQMLINGNILICEGANGKFFEIDREKKIVWTYINPIEGPGPVAPNPVRNQVFRCVFYEKAYPGLKKRKLKSQGFLSKPH